LSHFWDGAEEILPPEYLYASDVELQQKIIEHCKRPDPEKLSHQNYLRSLVHEKFNVAAMELRFREMLQGVAGARAGQ
jgi:hypothetical protein